MAKRIAIVGGGIAGLCTAVALVKRGVKPILLERKRIAGSHGSSHGPSRITRSVYADSLYVRIMQRLHREHWPAMEALLGGTATKESPMRAAKRRGRSDVVTFLQKHGAVDDPQVVLR